MNLSMTGFRAERDRSADSLVRAFCCRNPPRTRGPESYNPTCTPAARMRGTAPECARPRCSLHAFIEAHVAQISNLLYRRFPIGRVTGSSERVGSFARPAGWKPCDTADWKSALRVASVRDPGKEQRPRAQQRSMFGERENNPKHRLVRTSLRPRTGALRDSCGTAMLRSRRGV